MRYIYIICLLMSSFFTTKNCLATETLKYAFFLPQNIFQENTSVKDIDNMKPRYEKKSETSETTDNIKTLNQPTETLSKNSGLVNKMEEPKISMPYVRKPLKIEDNLGTTETEKQVKKEPLVAPETPEINDEIKKKLSQYTLSDEFDKDESLLTKQNDKQNLIKNEINKRLATIPYANRNLPMFKQCFSNYGSDLRILFHRGKFPSNHKQEETLSKVNNSRRFEVR